jgi:hypothetical protein
MPKPSGGKLQPINLNEILETLLGKYDSLAARIRHVDFSINDVYPRISVRGSYLAFRDGLPTIEDFVTVIHRRITSFCLPRNELRAIHDSAAKKSADEAAELWTAAVTRASERYIKAKKGSNRSGEATEIILFVLLESVLKAPQIVSKMYLKTNNDMPVHGTDGIHARYDPMSKELFLYWGESKAHKTLASALSSAIESLVEFIERAKEEKEIDIIHAHADLGGMTPEAKKALLDFFDPIKEESNKRKPVFACLLVFDYPSLSQVVKDEKIFITEFRATAKAFVQTLKDRLDDHDLLPRRFEFFLLPLSSVQQLRDLFQQKIGWPND